MISHLGILACPFTQREISVLAAPDIKLVQNKVCRDMRQKLRRLLRLNYSVLCTVLCKRGKQVVKRVHSVSYSLGRLELHDKQPARQLRPEIESNGYEPLKQLPDAFKIVLGVRKAAKALIIILLWL